MKISLKKLVLVEQDYELPNEVMEFVGFDVFQYEEFSCERFLPEEFSFEGFKTEDFELEGISVGFMRRGVIEVQRIGYI